MSMSMNIIEELPQILVDVQTELVFFCLAIGTHLLFFHKLRQALHGVRAATLCEIEDA